MIFNKIKRVALMFGLTACLAAVGGNGIAMADDVSTKFVPGTTINGVNIAGLNVDAAKAKLEETLSSEYQVTLKEKDGTTEKIKGSDFGYRVLAPDSLAALLEEQNAGGRISGPGSDNSHTMQLAVNFDEAALYDRIQALACISGSDIVTTSDAYVSSYQEGKPFEIVPEVLGDNLDLEKTKAAVKAAVAGGKNEVNLSDGGCYYTVSVTKDSQQLKDLCDTMNRCREMSITYVFGDQQEVLSGEVICTWLTGSDNGKIVMNQDMVAQYVNALAGKYNTVNTARTFKTNSGREVSLTGPFGWQMNQQAEIGALNAMIQTGQTQSREPEYVVRGASRSGYDWGNTYVEIDLSGQHVYLYKDGAVIWDAPCVTGNVSKDYTTPEGIYSLNYKARDRVLRGAKQKDGTYEYESPVDYWMPFNGGIGLHDANWRSKFGGTIYQYSGSHGCINLPPSKVPFLYEQIYAGIPVICYN